jgi:hypothetical protein
MSSSPLPPANPQQPAPPAVITIDSIVGAPESQSEVSNLSLELESKQAQIDRYKLESEEMRDNILRRGNWGNRIFWLLLIWLFSVIGVVVLQGFGAWHFHLDNSVLLTFIGTTTADVLGLGVIVANYLFKKPQ